MEADTEEDTEATADQHSDDKMKAEPETEKVVQPTLELSIPLDSAYATHVETMEDGGIDVESTVAQQIQPQVEETIHQIYQQAKYNE